jgi:hypothetical protein
MTSPCPSHRGHPRSSQFPALDWIGARCWPASPSGRPSCRVSALLMTLIVMGGAFSTLGAIRVVLLLSFLGRR